MKLILTRHGETVENKDGILQGWLPGKLTKDGIKQVKLAAKRLKDVKIDVIFTSDLKRCVDTAKEIKKFHKNSKFIKEKALRERNLGIFQGKNKNEVNWDENRANYNKIDFVLENGESFLIMEKRIIKFFKNVLKNYNKETVLIVCHGGTLRVLVGFLTRKNLEYSLKQDAHHNTAISEFEIDKKGNIKIICLNCNKHLVN